MVSYLNTYRVEQCRNGHSCEEGTTKPLKWIEKKIPGTESGYFMIFLCTLVELTAMSNVQCL